MKKALTLSITREQECLTIEQLLKRELHLSRREISRAKFQEKGICLNGRQVRVNQKGKREMCSPFLLRRKKRLRIFSL